MVELVKRRDEDGGGDGEVEGVSGQLIVGDVVILGTKQLFAGLEGEKANKALLGIKQVGAIVDQVAPEVHKTEGQMVAGILVGIVEDELGEQRQIREQVIEEKVEAVVMEEKSPSESLRERLNKSGVFSRRSMSQLASKVWLGFKRFKVKQTREVIYTEEQKQEKRRKMIGTVAILLFFLLLVSLGFAKLRQSMSAEVKEFEQVQEMVNMKVDESEDLRDINALRSRMLLVEAADLVEEYKIREGRYKKSDEWVESMESKIGDKISELLNIKRVEGEVFLDLELVREGSGGSLIDFDGENLLVLDSEAEVVLGIEVESKKAEVVGGGDLLRGASQAAVYFKRGFVLANRGVVELDLKRKTSAVVIDDEGRGEEWGEIGAMDVFGGNLYMLDKEKGNIYRYRGIEGGFGSRQGWLGAGIEPDYSKVVSMAIDGSIWILTESGRVEKYTQGTGKVIEVLGLDKELSEPSAIYADEESSLVYILDSGNSRVVVINKEGEYESQYQWEALGEMSDMVVSEAEGKILLLGGSKIYEIDK